MLCPSCGHANVPGADECARCLFPLASIDSQPTGDRRRRVERPAGPRPHAQVQPPVTIPVDGKLGLALDRMVEHGVGALLVVDADGRLVGILTERDYLRKVVGVVAGLRPPAAARIT